MWLDFTPYRNHVMPRMRNHEIVVRVETLVYSPNADM